MYSFNHTDRNNSTSDQARQIQDIRLGDNIYLRRLNSKGPAQLNQSRHLEEGGLRLEQDYEIG